LSALEMDISTSFFPEKNEWDTFLSHAENHYFGFFCQDNTYNFDLVNNTACLFHSKWSSPSFIFRKRPT
jgi:hypothetical protein